MVGALDPGRPAAHARRAEEGTERGIDLARFRRTVSQCIRSPRTRFALPEGASAPEGVAVETHRLRRQSRLRRRTAAPGEPGMGSRGSRIAIPALREAVRPRACRAAKSPRP